MKTYTSVALLATIGLLLCASGYSHSKDSTMTGPYLGQKVPGATPQLFAPKLVSTKEWGDAGSFSADMSKFYVIRWRMKEDKRETQLVTFKQVNNEWQKVAVSNKGKKPFYSPDGNTMYFGRQYKERNKHGWSEMKSLGDAFEKIRIMGLSASAKGTLVLDEVGTNGNGVIRYSRLVDGKREAPKPFGKEINTGTWNAHPYIAPDESYIMWDGERQSGHGNSDIYISFRLKDGSWGEAVNLGSSINTAAEEGGPQVTPDGKYLFFNRVITLANGKAQSDLFWVDAQIIDDLKPTE